MIWSDDMDAAPRGGVRIVTIERAGKPPFKRAIREKEWVFCLSKQGDVIGSYWVADAERWNGFEKDHPPVAWLAIPDHPLIAAARASSMQGASE